MRDKSNTQFNGFKNIHIGALIQQKVSENGIGFSRICNFFRCTENEITGMFQQENMMTDVLLRWSKLLEYDFFRIYSQHLILFAPQKSAGLTVRIKERSKKLPQFRKNIYTKELIDFILEQVRSGEKTRPQIIKEYKIPKSTLYKWIDKYSQRKE